ncbi:MAG TPA: peptidoglycan-binding domain-containing protein, partial [Acidobacteriota bacterium]|nr:peptidoglycan-binding domain-containing protein [Acidobacteriota bacterium]
NAAARISESAISSKLLATQLQSQVPSQKPVAVVGSAVAKKDLLFEGKTGPEVKDMQQQLNDWRSRNGLEPLKEDGIFGPKTKAAAQQFQDANGLKKDGIIGGNTRDRLALENNETFQKLNPQSQDQIRNMMNDSQKDPVARQNLLLIGTDEDFGKLSEAQQHTALTDVNKTASDIAEKKLQGMNNDQLLKLAEAPGGKDQLESLKLSLQSGPQTPAKLQQLDRINSATFTPAGGLKMIGTPANQAAYLHMTRREMLTSPTFAKTMNEINADKAHPVTVNVGRDMPNVRLDVDRGGGKQDIDMADFDKLPTSPTAANPHGITQGEVLSHAMREARQRALGQNHEKAHSAAIDEENKYRKEIGQTSFRKAFPDDESRVDNELGDINLVVHFDTAPDEELKFDKNQKLQR